MSHICRMTPCRDIVGKMVVAFFNFIYESDYFSIYEKCDAFGTEHSHLIICFSFISFKVAFFFPIYLQGLGGQASV
jgi:hypothetical protein